MYQEATGCPFPIYADPTKQLYNELGMIRTLALGSRPEYMRKSMIYSMARSVIQGLKQIKGGLRIKAGDIQQVGGEFLFEPVGDMTVSPMVTPIQEDGEEKKITWCHRMRNTRDHAEIPEIREVLGFNGAGISGRNKRRWSKALEIRKGTALSWKQSLNLEWNNENEKLMPSLANEATPIVLTGH
jgi:AhpC/TSA antioxidant enzyme